MCFPAIIPGWWRKNYRKLKFLWLSFWANGQMWYGVETIFFLIIILFHQLFFLLLFLIRGRRHCYTSSSLLVLFLSLWLETRWRAMSLGPCQHLRPLLVCLLFLFSHFRHTPPSIFLFFLNVIVKCSSEMTLNMCTLTEGIHLVIYFLSSVSCFFIIFFCWLKSIFTTSHIAHHLWRASTNGICSSHCSYL